MKRVLATVEIADTRRVSQLLAGRRVNPVIKDVGYELSNWPLYDRWIVAAAAAVPVTQQFFQVPIGGAITKNNTNMIKAGELPHPERFKVAGLRFIIASNVAYQDIDNLLRLYYCEFFIGNSIYMEGPLPLFPGGAGISGFTTRTAQASFQNGIQDVRAINLMGDQGPEIGQGENFRVVLTGTTFGCVAAGGVTFGTGLDVLCVLDGWKVRAVS